MLSFFSKSIVHRFNALILSLIIISLLGFSFLIGIYNYQRSINDLKTKSQNMSDLLSVSLQDPIWDYNDEVIESFMEAVFLDKDITAAQILGANSEEAPIFSNKLESLDHLSFQDLQENAEFLYNVGEIQREGEKIGEVHIVTSTTKAIQLIQQTSIIIAAFTTILISLIGGLVWWLGSQIIRRPINQLKTSSNQLAQGNLTVKINTNRQDELGSLAFSFSQMRDSIRKKLNDLRTLNATGETLAGLQDQPEALKKSLEVMQQKMGFLRGSIYLLNSDNELEMSAYFPETAEGIEAEKFQIGEGVAGKAAANKEVIYIPDTSQDPTFVTKEGQAPPKKALLCIPMLDDKEIFGVMNFFGEVGQVQFTKDDYDFAETISQITVITTKNIQMLSVIEEHNRTLEKKVLERTAAIKDLMDNTGQGFFAFGQSYLIHKEYSKACEQFFGKSISELNVLELLFSENQESVREILDLIFLGMSSLDVMEEMLPKEIRTASQILSVAYKWIPNQNDSADDKIMIILTDVTLERELEAQLKADEERNAMIIKVAGDREGFMQFLREIEKLFQLIFNLLKQPIETISANEIFRYYHTIKGGAASYGLQSVATKAHFIESYLENVRSGDRTIDTSLIGQITDDTTTLKSVFGQTLKNLEGLISPDEMSANTTRTYKVTDTKINQVQKVISSLSIRHDLRYQLLQSINNFRKQSIGPVLKKYASAAQEVAERLDKQIEVQLEGNDIEVFHSRFEHLFEVLIHLVRNSVDHGMEMPDLRVMLDKPPTGSIKIGVYENEKSFKMKISDDGGGIDAEVIKSIALKKGLISQKQAKSLSDQEAIQLIFSPGFSTKEEVSDISGRGVGLDAVKSALDDLKGSVHVQTKIDQGTTFEIEVPYH